MDRTLDRTVVGTGQLDISLQRPLSRRSGRAGHALHLRHSRMFPTETHTLPVTDIRYGLLHSSRPNRTARANAKFTPPPLPLLRFVCAPRGWISGTLRFGYRLTTPRTWLRVCLGPRPQRPSCMVYTYRTLFVPVETVSPRFTHTPRYTVWRLNFFPLCFAILRLSYLYYPGWSFRCGRTTSFATPSDSGKRLFVWNFPTF